MHSAKGPPLCVVGDIRLRDHWVQPVLFKLFLAKDARKKTAIVAPRFDI